VRRCLILIACFLSPFCGSRGYAAEMYCLQSVKYDTDPRLNGKTCTEIYIEGEIVAGDYQRFRDLLHFAEPFAHRVTLNSLGGNVAEALAIGRLIRDRLLETEAPYRPPAEYTLYSATRKRDLCLGKLCVCASACFFIWAGGIARLGDALMVHRPRDVSGTFATKAAAQASREYSATLSAIDSYLLEMEVPHSIIEKVNATPSNEIAFVEYEDKEMRPPSIAEWLISGCGSVRKEEDEWIWQLRRFEKGQVYLTPQQVAYARTLESARNAVWDCEIDKVFAERVQLWREQPLRKPELFLVDDPPEK
jgi:hypothetical protein